MTQDLCRVYWGSHGCSLPRRHADAAERHQCGLESDEDGVCSQVAWERPLLGGARWVWRFATVEGGWDGNPFPVVLFGEDAPANAGTPEEAERVRQDLQDAGVLARFVPGRGWVTAEAKATQ